MSESVAIITQETEWVTSSSYSLVNDRELAIFQAGKEKGEEELVKQIMDNYHTQLKKSYFDTKKVLEKIKEFNIDIVSARLKPEPFLYDVLISVRPSVNLSNNMSKIYDFIYEVEEDVNVDNYNIHFGILKSNEEDTDKNVENDGYIYIHGMTIDEKRPRKPQSRPL